MQLKGYIHLSAEEQATLEEGSKHDFKAHFPTRCETLLLSARGYQVVEIAQLFEVRTHPVRFWMDNWEQRGIVGLNIPPGRGRKLALGLTNAAFLEDLQTQIGLNPQSLAAVALDMSKKWHCALSKEQLQGFIKKTWLPLGTIPQVYTKMSTPAELPTAGRTTAGRPRLSITLAGRKRIFEDLLWG